MSKVHILPSDVIAKIAAGEVVDRPASVVKELMENALDAGADRVEVTLKDGGKTLIQVKDNGSGVERDDLERLFTRHATSKVDTAEDLDVLTSFGFRGEALYSIAAVSEVRMRTRVRNSSDAWELCLRGGERLSLAPAAAAGFGTELRVEDIFFNTPARKKFLRSDATELDQVIHAFVPCALLYYERAFTLSHNGRTVYDLKPAGSAADRAAACLNLDFKYLLSAREEVPGENIRLELVLGDINIQRPRRDLQYVFVNGRPVQHKNIVFQVNDVYRMIMPQGVHPFFIVFINLPPEDVDVNIHPQKREVRLRQESRLSGILRAAVERTLMTKGGARQMGAAAASEKLSSLNFTPGFTGQTEVVLSETEQGIPADRIVFHPRQGGEGLGASLFAGGMTRMSAQGGGAFSEGFPAREESLRERLARGRFIGTFICKYHLFEEGGSLFLVDQHAAQERIIFERIQRQIAAGQVDVQRLLVPLAVRLNPAEMLAWEHLREKLDALGFETNLFNADTVSVSAHPALLAVPENVLRQLLADEALQEADIDALARRACRASVMSGDRMRAEAAEYQLKELLSCRDPMTCPHGRPVFIEMKQDFLDRQFFRI